MNNTTVRRKRSLLQCIRAAEVCLLGFRLIGRLGSKNYRIAVQSVGGGSLAVSGDLPHYALLHRFAARFMGPFALEGDGPASALVPLPSGGEAQRPRSGDTTDEKSFHLA